MPKAKSDKERRQRTNEVRIRLNDDEYKAFIARAGDEQLAPFIRRVILKKRKSRRPKITHYTDEQKQALSLLRSMSNNLNQIAKQANKTQQIDVSSLVGIERSIIGLLGRLL